MTKEELLLLGAADVKRVGLEDGKSVFVRSLSLADVAEAEGLIKSGNNALAVWTVLSVCDEAGNRTFALTDLADVAQIPARIGKRICEAAIEHNGLGTVEDATDPNP